jgi:hypothetical protein
MSVDQLPWDTCVLSIPFLVILGMTLFRLDERLASSRGVPKRRRSFCEVDSSGYQFLSDPDGQSWPKQPKAQIEARIIPSTGSPGL